jgi:hypothetical protein
LIMSLNGLLLNTSIAKIQTETSYQMRMTRNT